MNSHEAKQQAAEAMMPAETWQTQARGTNEQEYRIYLSCADDGHGRDFTTSRPLKTYDEWLNS